jgi:hypothetical protein
MQRRLEYIRSQEASMSASAAPKQGDHVFNAVDAAVLHPYETMFSLRTALVDGQQFVHDYLLHSYSFVRDIARNHVLVAARKYVATAGNEQDAVRELIRLASRHPVLRNITPGLLRDVHTRNAERFGDAAAEYEIESLLAVRQALERAVAPADAPPAARITHGPGLAFQHLLDNAYDPAAALSVIICSMAFEQPGVQSNFHSVIVGIAETLNRPGAWKEPYAGFRESRRTNTGETITNIGNALLRMDGLKGQSVILAKWINDEIAQKARTAGADAIFGSMIPLLHTRLQQMGCVS